MTTFANQDAPCPICNETITIKVIMSTNNFGGQETDFRSHPVGFDPLHMVISQCSACGYSDYGHYFVEPRELSDAVKARIRAESQPPPEGDRRTSRMYETAARIAAIRGGSTEEIANYYLRAAWCSHDEGDTDGERAFRRKAIENFEQALDAGDIRRDCRTVIMYLVGELYRRLDDRETARVWFDRVIDSNDPSPDAAQIRLAAEQQRDNPQEKF